jgi:hypothetical protein
MKKLSAAGFGLLATLISAAAFAGDTAPPPISVPEPGTLALLALGVAGIAAARLRGRK